MDNQRLDSIDAFRGLDMLFLVGLAPILVSVCLLFEGGANCWLVRQMEHAQWNGLTIMDMVFPIFLFISGISFPFSYAKQQALGRGRTQIYRKNIRRALLLVLFGLLYNGILQDFTLSHIRFYSVLGRIGLAWFLASVLYMNINRRSRERVCVALLLVYSLILKLFTAPDAPGADSLSLEGNIAGYLSRKAGIGAMYLGSYDPENLLGLIPSTVTASLGMLTGEYIREGKVSAERKTLAMLLSAAGLLCAGLVWSIWFPLNKNLWSSSFTLVVGAIALALFALFFWIMDVKNHKAWAFPLKVIGMNSITVYMATAFIDYGFTTKALLGGVMSLTGNAWGELIYNIGYLALVWASMYLLYRKRIFLKV